MTIAVTEWRGGFRREMNRTDNLKGARATDALINYETVKLFTAEGHELQEFDDAINQYQRAEFRFTVRGKGGRRRATGGGIWRRR